MHGLDQRLQVLGLAVGAGRCVEIDTVVTPIAEAWKLRNGHQLNGVDSEPPQRPQLAARGRIRAVRSESPDVQLICGLRGPARDGAVARGAPTRGEQRAFAVHSVRLPAGPGVGKWALAVEQHAITIARPDS